MTRQSLSTLASTKSCWAAYALAALAVSSCGVDPEAELAAAEERFAAGDLRTAAIHVSALLQEVPEHVQGRILRGRMLLAAGDPAGARLDLERASAGGAEVEILLAEALLDLGQTDEALARLGTVPESARDPVFWALQAEALLAAERLGELEALIDAGYVDASSSRSFLVRARLASRRGDATTARDLFASAVAAAGTRHERIEALLARGGDAVQGERLVDASNDLRMAAELSAEDASSPREVAVLAGLVQLGVARNEIAEAAEWAAELTERAPNVLAARYARGLVAYEEGRLTDAVTELQQALRQAPDDALLATLLGAAHLGKDELFQAEQHLLRALAVAPTDPAAVKLLAETRLRQQRPQAALDALRPLAGTSADGRLDALKGIAHLHAGHVREGIAFLEQAVASNSASDAVRLELARAYISVGKSDRVAAVLEGLAGEDRTLTELMLRVSSELASGDRDTVRLSVGELLRIHGNDARAHVAAAAAHHLFGEGGLAIERLRDAVRLDAGFVPARLLLVGLLSAEGRRGEAERLLQEAVAAQPDNADLLAAMAQFAIDRGDLDESEALLSRAVVAEPSSARRFMFVRVLLARGKLDVAKEQVDAAAAADPGNVDARAARGMYEMAAGRPVEATQLFGTLYSENPGRLDFALALAQAQANSGDIAAGRDTLLAASRTASPSLEIRAALGTAQLRAGEIAAALEIAKDLQVSLPRQAAGYVLEARVRLAQRRYSTAAEYYELGFARYPSWDVLQQWTEALRLAGQPERIERALGAWLAERPQHVNGRLLLASALSTAGRGSDALAEYERVLTLAPDNVIALNNAAWLRHRAGDPTALELAQRANELAPDHTAVLDTLGWILTTRGELEAGLNYLEQAIAAGSDAADIQYHYAFALASLGRRDEAREILERLIALPEPFPSKSEAQLLLGRL